jgi:cytochrome P450
MWLDSGRLVSSSPLPPQRYAFPSVIAAPPFGTTAPTANDVTVLSTLVIAAQSPHPTACWQWLTFLSAEPAFIQSGFPARRSVAESEAYLAQARPGASETYAAYRKALTRAGAWRTLLPSASDGDLTWLDRAVERALQGGDLERQVQTAQRLTEEYLACVRGGGTRTDCAQQVDPSGDGG